MQFSELALDLEKMATPLPVWRAECSASDWSAVAQAMASRGGRLLCLWGRDCRQQRAGCFVISAILADKEGMLWLDLPLVAETSSYPDLAGIFPYAGRMQRALADLLGITADGAADCRPWLNHGAWPANYYPLRHEAHGDEVFADCHVTDYPFVHVAGDGVHEIAVGPVHAGIIEPGHFRFSVIGEKVLRLEERLGYTHKGIAKRFEQLPASQGHRLAGRVCGDSTVAYAWAYCMALESISAASLPPRALALRALLLERERVANHLGDLGALGNDAAFGFGLAQFMRLKEDWLRLNKSLFGHRLAMDKIVPGGVDSDLDGAGAVQLLAQCEAIEKEVRVLRSIYENHAGLQDRFITTGRVTPQLAAKLGLSGLAGRASGVALDLRADFAPPPYDELKVRRAVLLNGDVAARVALRFDEVLESLRLIRQLAVALPPGEWRVELTRPAQSGGGVGWIEGWRGEVVVLLESDGEKVHHSHCHDPSWQNWPVLEHAVMDNIVPDFPLINKSFNLSYSGNDC